MSRKICWRAASAIFLSLWCFIGAGCSAPMRVFIHPEADMAFYERVGVVPFQSLSNDRLAGDKFSVEFQTALLAAEIFDVVDYGVFVSQLTRTLGSRPVGEGVNPEDLQKVGEVAGVQGVFIGTVMQYEMTPTSSGTFPVISVQVRLIDVETATVVWMASLTERGGPKTPIIGVGEVHTLGELAQRMSQRLISKLE